MKRKFAKSFLFLTFTLGLLFSFNIFSQNNVEALSAATNLCQATTASIHSSSPTRPTCSGTTLVFSFEYDYNVTGFSSGSDGY